MFLPDEVYNWLVDFFSNRRHCTKFCGTMSGELNVTGSAIDPASYVINAADLTTVTAGNLMFKYADDTYNVISAANVNSRYAELDHVDRWAQNNNLRLNGAKSVELYSPTESVSLLNICLYRYRTFAVSPLSRSSESP